MHVVRRFLPHATAQRRALILLAILIPADIARQLVSPEILRRFVDSAVSGQAMGQLAELAVAYSLVALIGYGLGVAASHVASRAAWGATNRLRGELVRHCVRQDPAFYQRRSPGELVDRMDGDVTKMAGVMSGMMLEIAAQVLLVIGILAALFYVDVRFGLVFTPFALLMGLLLKSLAGRAIPILSALRQSGAELLGFLEERLAGAEDIGPNGTANHMTGGLWARMRAQYTLARRAVRRAAAWPVAVQALSAVNFSVALGLGVWLYNRGEVSIGSVFAGLSYATLLRLPLMSITSRFQDIEDVVVSMRRLDALLDEASPLRDGAHALAPGPKEVTLDRVWFAYGDRPALRDVSLRIAAGECVGVIGRTGSGKSTLLRLLFRQYDPDRGAVYIDGTDVRELRIASLRGRVTLVTQEVHLLHASLRDNLTFFNPAIPDRRLRAALSEVGLDEWLAALPAGLDTVLGHGVVGLSAGQEQLVALARALLTDPDVVLFDEPSARLDPQTERLLHGAITRFVKGRSAVIVAHRPQTLQGVDRIVRLEGGEVVGTGTPEEMLVDAGVSQ